MTDELEHLEEQELVEKRINELESDRNLFSALLCALVLNDWDMLGGTKKGDTIKVTLAAEMLRAAASGCKLSIGLSDDKENITIGVETIGA